MRIEEIMILQLDISYVSINIRMDRAYVAYQEEKMSQVKIKTKVPSRRYSDSEKVNG